jgi:hypothetical protein
MKYVLLPLAFLVSASAFAASSEVAALNSGNGESIRFGDIFSSKNKTVELVDRQNTRISIAPHSVVEFQPYALMRLLRGAAVVESQGETEVRTPSATVQSTGRVAISYDHRERSTSAFSLAGEARILGAGQSDRSLRVERYRGATFVVGDVLPSLVRQLDIGGLRQWMNGFAWTPEQINQFTSGLPSTISAKEESGPEHLATAKLEDYFSALEEPLSDNRADIYERKFSDPDHEVAEANAPKDRQAKVLSPEEAALIALPSTKIDLGLDSVLTLVDSAKKQEEISAAKLASSIEGARRAPASLKKTLPSAVKKQKVNEQPKGEPSEIGLVLQRLRSIEAKAPVVSVTSLPSARVGLQGSRSPASQLLLDPVRDYSENF